MVVSPVVENGEVTSLIVVSRDITELYLAREALRQADRRKDEFLMLLTHELRNPLSAASMAATVLQAQPLDAERTVQLGKLVARQVGHMSRLVEDLNDISRVSAGLISLRMAPLKLAQVVAEAVEQVQDTVRAKRHVLTVSLCDPEPMVSGDHTRLVQVVANLLGNAARYTPEGGSIGFPCASRQAWLCSMLPIAASASHPKKLLACSTCSGRWKQAATATAAASAWGWPWCAV